MITTTRSRGCVQTPSPESTPLLRWVFARNHAALTCEVDVDAAGGYAVSVIPHWDVSRAAIERFEAAVPALERHAEMARYLRESGWHLADRGAGGWRRAA